MQSRDATAPAPRGHTMPHTPCLALVALLAALTACRRPPEERAFEACRGEIARRLVDPTSAVYRKLGVAKRSGDGASVVDGWDVEVSVEAHAADRKTIARSSVKCTLGVKFDLLNLTGEQYVER